VVFVESMLRQLAGALLRPTTLPLRRASGPFRLTLAIGWA
jgi:hypothetical protein